MRWFALVAFFLAWAVAGELQAQEGPGDGAYGRLDGDVMLSFGLGGGPVVGGTGDAAFLGEFRARYLDMVGVFVAPELRLGAGGEEGRIALGVELRPLWPIRFFLNGFSGNEWLDLFIESVSAEVGVAILPLGDGVGAGLALGFGIDVPILVPSVFADGLFLHLGGRHVRAGAADQAGPGSGGISDWLISFVLTLKVGVDTGVVGLEPPRYSR
ncbi:MAG: hypothetical protein JRH11_11620 [Deltaproteobacteria bacterium]|nr:hypothetical protein [Deltaproteobacteria bacterium]